MKQVDLIIIGSGPGGYETALRAAQHGLVTALIESKNIGGVCLNEGCIPTKCFCRNAALLNDLKNPSVYGIEQLSYSFDFKKVIERKNQVVQSLKDGIKTLLKHPKIIFIQGTANFIDSHTVEVPNAKDLNGQAVETKYTARNLIIATGSVPKFLPIEGAQLPGVCTSTEMLNIESIPQKLCIIGGGVIGLEFASIFQTFGSQVTVIEFCKEILPNFDSDIAKRLRMALKEKGITFFTQAAAQMIKKNEDSTYTVLYNHKNETKETEADVVLMAVGRNANVKSLNLSDIGLTFDKKGIYTNEYMQTNIPHIYAIGDVNGKCQLAHAATFQGIRALNHIIGKKDQIVINLIPAAVFTIPEAATVGLTEQQCKESGINFKTHKAFFRSNGKALAMNEPEGLVKLLSDETGKIIGCQILGPHAADLIQEIATLIYKEGTIADLRQSIHAHPTLGEVVMNAAWS